MWFGKKKKEVEKVNHFDEEYEMLWDDYTYAQKVLKAKVYAALNANFACSVVPQGSYSYTALEERAKKAQKEVENQIVGYKKAQQEAQDYYTLNVDKMVKCVNWTARINAYEIVSIAVDNWTRGERV